MNEIQYIQKHGVKNARYPAYNNLDEQLKADGFTGDIQALKQIISGCELIEQLGGYEKAKDKFRDNGSFHAERMKAALLAHRRANNIFEVGDYVLPNSNYSEQVHFLSEWYIDGLDFRYKTSSGGWGIIVKSCMGNAWRHATDEEIKANRRLDQ